LAPDPFGPMRRPARQCGDGEQRGHIHSER
jgi:hypothetical protein